MHKSSISEEIHRHYIVPLLATAFFGFKTGVIKANEWQQEKVDNRAVPTKVISSEDQLPPIPDISFPDIEQVLPVQSDKSLSNAELPVTGAETTPSNIVNGPIVKQEQENQNAADSIETKEHTKAEHESSTNKPPVGNVWESLARKLPAPAVQLMAYSLAILSVLAAIRGVVKGIIEIRTWRSKENRIKSWNLTDAFQVDFVGLHKNGTIKLSAIARSSLKVDEVLVTGGAKTIFLTAAAKCTDEQPFVLLNLPPERKGWFFNRRETGRYEYMRRIHDDIIPCIQEIYHNSSIGRAEVRQLYAETENTYEYQDFLIIPICEVTKLPGATSRKLKLLTINLADLDIIRNQADIKVNQDTNARVLEVIREVIKILDSNSSQQLFPVARVYVKPASVVAYEHASNPNKVNSLSRIVETDMNKEKSNIAA